VNAPGAAPIDARPRASHRTDRQNAAILQPMSTDRELRNRIEALEGTVKRLSEDAEALRSTLATPVAPIFAVQRREAMVFELFGSLPEPIAMVLIVFVCIIPCTVSVGVLFGGAPPIPPMLLLAAVVSWMLFCFFLLVGGYSTARTLHRLRAAVRTKVK
jgi:hypothetical protein